MTIIDSGMSLSAPELAAAVDSEYLFAEVTISYTASSQLIENTKTVSYDAVSGLWKTELNVLADTEFTIDVTWYDMLDVQGRRANLTSSSTSARSGSFDSALTLSFDFTDDADSRFDEDSDGFSNLEERDNGTDPFVPTASPNPDVSTTEAGLITQLIIEGEEKDNEYSTLMTVRESRWIATEISPELESICEAEAPADSLDFLTTLEEACTTSEDCFMQFDQISAGLRFGPRYRIRGPQKLKAPVSLQYELHVVDTEMNIRIYPHLFCLTAENLPPVAVADSFVVESSGTLIVSASDDGINLLSNDSDDEHAANQPLVIDSEPVVSLRNQAEFTLESDGGFSYAPEFTAHAALGHITDSFTYSVTDGLSTSTAQVTIRTYDASLNKPPEALSPIPLQVFNVGVGVGLDLSEYFDDFNSSLLSYRIIAGNLPPSGGLQLSRSGVLSGVAQIGDEGSYSIEIEVSDLTYSINANLSIEIIDNLAPTATATEIPDAHNVLTYELFQEQIEEFFSDPEGEALNYTLVTEPSANMTINPVSGYIAGKFFDPGVYKLTVTATDRINDPITRSFNVSVE